MNRPDYKSMFKPDSGSLLDILVFDTDLYDWRKVLKFLGESYVVGYSEDGDQADLPDIEIIFQRRNEKSPALEALLPGFTVNCHFFATEEIQLDLLPEDVDTAEKAESVFRLLTDLAALLEKEVLLTPEFGSGTPQQRREKALCIADPARNELWFSES